MRDRTLPRRRKQGGLEREPDTRGRGAARHGEREQMTTRAVRPLLWALLALLSGVAHGSLGTVLKSGLWETAQMVRCLTSRRAARSLARALTEACQHRDTVRPSHGLGMRGRLGISATSQCTVFRIQSWAPPRTTP